MQRVVLLYNPAAGKLHGGRREVVEGVARALERADNTVEMVATLGPGSAGDQAREAARRGAEVIFSRGGDGTLNEVLQGMARTDGVSVSPSSLGVIPLGSANVVARHLGLPMDPTDAARIQMGWTAEVLPVGRVQWEGKSRAFLALAGAGPDGALVYQALAAGKARYGRAAYYVQAASLFCTRRFHPFLLEYRAAESGEWSRMDAVSAMTVRVKSLGGLFSRVTSGTLHGRTLELSVLLPPAAYSLPAWFASGYAGAHRLNPLLRRLQGQAFRCTPKDGKRLDVQADGEWLGCAPVEISIETHGVRLLTPPGLRG